MLTNSMKLKLIVFFCLFSSILFAQTKADLCKTSIKSYCKKNYSLYKPLEFKEFDKNYYYFDNDKINFLLKEILSKKNELNDTVLIEELNDYILSEKEYLNHNHLMYFNFTTGQKGVVFEKVKMFKIGEQFYNKFLYTKLNNTQNLKVYDSILITNVVLGDEVLNYDEKGNILQFSLEPRKLYKPAYIYCHIYESLDNVGIKRYHKSIFYIDTKTYKVIDEVVKF